MPLAIEISQEKIQTKMNNFQSTFRKGFHYEEKSSKYNNNICVRETHRRKNFRVFNRSF